MPDKASAAIPEKSLQERLEDAKALAENGGLMSFAGRAEIPLIEELMDLTAQLETAQGLYDDANRDWRAMKVRAEQAEAKVARLSTPVSNEEWIKANYQQGIATGIPKDQEGKESVMTWRQFTTRKDIDALIASRLATPEPPKEAQ